ncbi:hypothetical protein A4A49_30673 [Nicotiana attenuata]|uniref:G-patch domain-containing protein n=1 Tax=Nicotiana attenuata TaxID=49451 RepID=A0A1J6JXA8_NICAT|nr:hypothetical protein A4A49_30673 [Nicotiana attenuata]
METTEIEETKQNLRMQSPYRSKMAMREMMKYGYKPGTKLGARSDGIIEPIEPNRHKDRADIGYQPSNGKTCTGSFRKKAFVPELISIMGQSSMLEDDIVDGMGRLFVTMIEECCDKVDVKTPTIRDAELGEDLRNWTAGLSLVRWEF